MKKPTFVRVRKDIAQAMVKYLLKSSEGEIRTADLYPIFPDFSKRSIAATQANITIAQNRSRTEEG